MITKIAKISCLGLLVALLIFCLVTVGEAKKAEKKDKSGTDEDTTEGPVDEPAVEVKEILGEVSGIGSKFVVVVYRRDVEKGIDYEMLFTMDKNEVEIAQARDLSKISIGDTVKIQYEEKTEQADKVNEDGVVERVTKVTERKATKITFISPPQKGLY